MMLSCQRCNIKFEAADFRGYCDNCLVFFQSVRDQVHEAQQPAPGVYLDGKVTKEECHRSFLSPITKQISCGLCGSSEVRPGYGLGSGYGLGTYNFCWNCNNFLDFCEDME